jgi:hypothetical protein
VDVEVRDFYVMERTKTDASGRYHVTGRGFQSPIVWVTASHDRFQFQPCATWFEQGASDPAERTVDVRLSSAEALSSAVPGHTAGRRHVSGTIYASTATGREPASNALVMWDLSNDDYRASTRADAAGRFTLCGLPVNGRGLVFAALGNQWAWSLVEAGGDVAIEVTLENID